MFFRYNPGSAQVIVQSATLSSFDTEDAEMELEQKDKAK